MSTPNERGKRFEEEIESLLLALRSGREDYVEVTPQAKIKLYGDVPQEMKPDFELRIHWPHETAVYLIEVRDRKRSGPDIAAKIDRLKKLSKHNSFIYVYKDKLEEVTKNALEQDGVGVMSLAGFAYYLMGTAEDLDDLVAAKVRRYGHGYREGVTGTKFIHYRGMISRDMADELGLMSVLMYEYGSTELYFHREWRESGQPVDYYVDSLGQLSLFSREELKELEVWPTDDDVIDAEFREEGT